MEVRRVVIDYAPRRAFVPYHNRTQRWSVIVAHRRAGKTVATVNDVIRRAIVENKPDGRYSYIAPLYNQAKDIAWTYLKRYAYPLLADSPNETELRVDLINGSRIRLYGADNPDRLRGQYFDGVVLDEYGDMNPSMWPEVIRPALADRLGWATFIGTPKGKNAFHDVWVRGQRDPEWFALMLRASESGILDEVELINSRRDMGEDRYDQELECSFEAAIQGAYYAKHLQMAQKEGRIVRLTPDPLIRKRAFWDIGGAGAKADHMAIWIAQWVDADIRVLDYIEGQGQTLAYYVNELRQRGHGDAVCYLPHDGVNTNNITGKRYRDHVEEAGFETEVIENQGQGAAMMRIEAARRIFGRIWFNTETTERGRDCLASYHEKRDEARNVGLGPSHDEYSHAADAFGLMCVAYEEPHGKPAARRRPRGNGSWMAG